MVYVTVSSEDVCLDQTRTAMQATCMCALMQSSKVHMAHGLLQVSQKLLLRRECSTLVFTTSQHGECSNLRANRETQYKCVAPGPSPL